MSWKNTIKNEEVSDSLTIDEIKHALRYGDYSAIQYSEVKPNSTAEMIINFLVIGLLKDESDLQYFLDAMKEKDIKLRSKYLKE
jgi:hypothetical protein